MNIWEEQRKKYEKMFFKIAFKWDLGIATKESSPESLGHRNGHGSEILCLIETGQSKSWNMEAKRHPRRGFWKSLFWEKIANA